MRKVLVWISLTIAVTPATFPAQAKSKDLAGTVALEKAVTTLNALDSYETLFRFMKSGASDADLKYIETQINATKGERLPRYSVHGTGMLIQGMAEPIFLSAQKDGIEVRYRDKVWHPTSSVGIKMSIVELEKMFDARSSSNVFDLFIPDAHAMGAGGAAVGVYAGVAVYLYFFCNASDRDQFTFRNNSCNNAFIWPKLAIDYADEKIRGPKHARGALGKLIEMPQLCFKLPATADQDAFLYYDEEDDRAVKVVTQLKNGKPIEVKATTDNIPLRSGAYAARENYMLGVFSFDVNGSLLSGNDSQGKPLAFGRSEKGAIEAAAQSNAFTKNCKFVETQYFRFEEGIIKCQATKKNLISRMGTDSGSLRGTEPEKEIARLRDVVNGVNSVFGVGVSCFNASDKALCDKREKELESCMKSLAKAISDEYSLRGIYVHSQGEKDIQLERGQWIPVDKLEFGAGVAK